MIPTSPQHIVEWLTFYQHMDWVYHSPYLGSSTSFIDKAIKNLTSFISNTIDLHNSPTTLASEAKVLPLKLQFETDIKRCLNDAKNQRSRRQNLTKSKKFKG